jgi:hypothetical protein
MQRVTAYDEWLHGRIEHVTTATATAHGRGAYSPTFKP